MQFADVKTDIAFRKIFGNEQHKEILIGFLFLNAILDLQGDKRIRSLAVRSNSSKSSGLKSRQGNCPYAPVA